MLCDLLNSLHFHSLHAAVLLRVARLIILPSAPASLSVLGGGGVEAPLASRRGRGGNAHRVDERKREMIKNRGPRGTQVLNCHTKQ